MSYADERQTKALESIARELKGIGRTLKRFEELATENFGKKSELEEAIEKLKASKSPGTCYMTEETCNKCETWNGDGCEYLVRPGEPWPERSRYKLEHVVVDDPFCKPWPKVNSHIDKVASDTTNIWICGSTGLPCIECTPGACDHRRTEGGGNG